MRTIVAVLLLGAIMSETRGQEPEEKPRPFPDVKAPDFPMPRSLEEWKSRREEVRKTLWNLLGDLPPRPPRPAAEVLQREDREGYRLEKVALDNGAGAKITSYLMVPKGDGPFPAVLYLHWHAGQYALGKEELFLDTPAKDGKRGEDLVKRGFAVFAPDAYAFGERRGQGPGGPREKGGAEEMALSKTFLWMGRTFMGMMVRDDQIALDYLSTRPEVDPRRIGATGISMGCTRAWWLAALDERVAAAVGVCCMTRYQDLVAAGGVNGHGIYYYVPGVLKHFDMEAVVSLIAPRPYLDFCGEKDGLTPPAGTRKIYDFCGGVWRLTGAPEHFRGVIVPDLGHAYTPEMWKEMTGWFERHLLRK